MTAFIRLAVAVIALGAISACTSSSDESRSATRACAPEKFACNGFTPGFWSNKNGCAQLTADPTLYERLNAFLEEAGLDDPMDPVDTCAEVAELVQENATDMAPKLLAMWIAFALNQWSSWEGDCYGGDIDFAWYPGAWLPGNADATCEGAVDGWFLDSSVTFAELRALALELLLTGSRCEQETLKNFFDAVNNDARLCLCDCPTGATGATGGYGE